MSHEKTITIKTDKGFVNIPTVVKGKTVTRRAASQMHLQGTNPAFGKPHKTIKSAVDAAKARSKGGR